MWDANTVSQKLQLAVDVIRADDSPDAFWRALDAFLFWARTHNVKPEKRSSLSLSTGNASLYAALRELASRFRGRRPNSISAAQNAAFMAFLRTLYYGLPDAIDNMRTDVSHLLFGKATENPALILADFLGARHDVFRDMTAAALSAAHAQELESERTRALYATVVVPEASEPLNRV